MKACEAPRKLGTLMGVESRHHGGLLGFGMIFGLKLRRRPVSDGFEQPSRVESVHPLLSGEFNRLQSSPMATLSDHFSLVKSNDRFHQGIVVGIANGPDRRLDPGFSQAFAVSNREVLNAAVALVNQPVTVRPSLVQGLLQCVQDQVGRRVLDIRQRTIRRVKASTTNAT